MFSAAGRTDALKLVPLFVGNLPEEKYQAYAKVLLELFMDERTVFVVSSDFCHYGRKHNFILKSDEV